MSIFSDAFLRQQLSPTLNTAAGGSVPPRQQEPEPHAAPHRGVEKLEIEDALLCQLPLLPDLPWLLSAFAQRRGQTTS